MHKDFIKIQFQKLAHHWNDRKLKMPSLTIATRKTTIIMRPSILIFIISLVGIDTMAPDAKQINSFKFLAEPDTIIAKNPYGYIYITSDTAAKMYDWLVPNPNNQDVLAVYADYINHIKKNFKQKLVINNIKGFPRGWNSVHVFQNKYFVYSPSDWIANTGYYISDSIIYETNSDPDDLFFILNYKRLAKDLNEFRTINYFGKQKYVQIKLVDSRLGIYVWSFINEKHELESRYLMQDSRYAKNLPMIVCDCGENKCVLEFKFDEPDFE